MFYIEKNERKKKKINTFLLIHFQFGIFRLTYLTTYTSKKSPILKNKHISKNTYDS